MLERCQFKSHIESLDKEFLIYKEMYNSNSMRPFGKEPKVDSIILIREYRVRHGI